MAKKTKINQELLIDLAKDNMFGLGNWGMCTNCGDEQDGCEDDAAGYECTACGENAVYGAGELLIMGYGE